MFNSYFGNPAHEQHEKRFPFEPATSQLKVFETTEFLYQNLISTMNSQRKMMEEIDAIKVQLLQVKEQNRSYLQRIHALETQKREAEMEDRKGKKNFRKNIYCPIETCGNKYSSKIALNSHMRTKHRKGQCPTVSSKTTESQNQ